MRAPKPEVRGEASRRRKAGTDREGRKTDGKISSSRTPDTPDGVIPVVWVTWQGRREVQVPRGITLLEGLLGAGLPVPHQCREARCGRCRVRVTYGLDALTPVGERERLRLGSMAPPATRLLCQTQVLPEGGSPGGIVLEP